jgi:hypothetical protein
VLGSNRDNDVGARGMRSPSNSPPPPLHEEKRIKAQIRGGDFQPQELNAKT